MTTEAEKEIEVPKWTESKVKIATPKGEIEVPALVNALCPGLAVTMPDIGVFNVTHAATGKKLSRMSYERMWTAAYELVEWWMIGNAAGMSWTDDDPAKLYETLKAHENEDVPFDGATSTSGGVTRKQTIKDWLVVTRTSLPFDEFPWEEQHPSDFAHKLLTKIAEGSLSPDNGAQ